MMGDVVSFAKLSHGGKSYRVEFVLFEERNRRQWAIVEREPDGTESYLAVCGGRKSEAEHMANVWTRVEAHCQRKREMLAYR